MPGHHPVYALDDQDALLKVATSVQRVREFDWAKFLLRCGMTLHLVAAVVVGTWPYEQLLTEGTRPVFELAPRSVWALLFIGGGLLLLALSMQPTTALAAFTGLLTSLVGGAWLTAQFLAVKRGDGSPMALAMWPFLYLPWLTVVARLAAGKR